MVLSLKPERIKRYKDVVALLIKYGRSDLVQQNDLELVRAAREALATTEQAKTEELASDLEQLGPTFIKLGQLLSTRGDLLPEPYLAPLAKLQDHVKPIPFREVKQVVSAEL